MQPIKSIRVIAGKATEKVSELLNHSFMLLVNSLGILQGNREEVQRSSIMFTRFQTTLF